MYAQRTSTLTRLQERRSMTRNPDELRTATSRAYYFLELAENFRATELNDFEAHIEAAILFGRTAFHRLQTNYRKYPGWQKWWDSLAADASVNFFRKERDIILKEGPSKVGRNVWIGSGGGPPLAKNFYYYEDYQTPA